MHRAEGGPGQSRKKRKVQVDVSERANDQISRVNKTQCERSSFWSRKSLRLRQRSDDEFLEDLWSLTKLTWDVYHVSPLRGFEEREVRLKQYALNLRNRCTSLKVQENVQYHAEFKVVRGLSKSDKDMAIKVEVQCSEEEKPKKIIYIGLLMSWGASEENPAEFLYLPILLCRGRLTTKKLVHEALHEFFDCIIAPQHLTQINMIWLNSLFLSVCAPSRKGQGNVVKFTLVEPWESGARFEYKMVLKEVKAIWNSIHPEDEDVLGVEEVRTLYEGLMEHISQITLMNLQPFKLVEIRYPDVVVKANGKIVCKTVEILDEFLSFLYSELPVIDVRKMDFEESIQ